jgi:hypothetical protein
VLLYAVPIRFVSMTTHTYPATALRIERLREHRERTLGGYRRQT